MGAMTDHHDDGTRSLAVTDDLVRDMTRDVTTVLLRTRQTLVVWCALAVAVLAALVLVAAGAADVSHVPFVVAVPLLGLALVLGVRRSVRRALAVLLAPGTTVSARVTADALHTRVALGSSQTAWTAYRDLRVRGSAAVLRLRGSAAFAVLPSALFTDDDLQAMRDAIG